MWKGCSCEEMQKINLQNNQSLKRTFWIVLIINIILFAIELGYGIISHSNALMADSLDNLSDAFVYGISLFVVSKGIIAKANASLVKGAVMALLGFFVVGEAIYKISYPVIPVAEVMTIVGIVAIVANATCLWLLTRHKHTDLNARSAWACSLNDVIGNVSVIIASFLVTYFHSMWPDILISLMLAMIILYSSVGVIQEALVLRKSKCGKV